MTIIILSIETTLCVHETVQRVEKRLLGLGARISKSDRTSPKKGKACEKEGAVTHSDSSLLCGMQGKAVMKSRNPIPF